MRLRVIQNNKLHHEGRSGVDGGGGGIYPLSLDKSRGERRVELVAANRACRGAGGQTNSNGLSCC
jgi:hypothetical protein